MSYETLLTEARDGIGVVTVNRPEVRNALNRRVMEEMRAVLDGFREDDGVGAVLFTGAGRTSGSSGRGRCSTGSPPACSGSTTR